MGRCLELRPFQRSFPLPPSSPFPPAPLQNCPKLPFRAGIATFETDRWVIRKGILTFYGFTFSSNVVPVTYGHTLVIFVLNLYPLLVHTSSRYTQHCSMYRYSTFSAPSDWHKEKAWKQRWEATRQRSVKGPRRLGKKKKKSGKDYVLPIIIGLESEASMVEVFFLTEDKNNPSPVISDPSFFLWILLQNGAIIGAIFGPAHLPRLCYAEALPRKRSRQKLITSAPFFFHSPPLFSKLTFREFSDRSPRKLFFSFGGLKKKSEMSASLQRWIKKKARKYFVFYLKLLLV